MLRYRSTTCLVSYSRAKRVKIFDSIENSQSQCTNPCMLNCNICNKKKTQRSQSPVANEAMSLGPRHSTIWFEVIQELRVYNLTLNPYTNALAVERETKIRLCCHNLLRKDLLKTNFIPFFCTSVSSIE